MSEWTELSWTGVGLIIASVILVMAFSFAGLGKNLEAQMYEDQATTVKLQEIRAMAPYDETTLSGSEVLAAMLELSSRNVPTICLVKSGVSFAGGVGDARAFMLYNEASTAGKAAQVFMEDKTTNVYKYVSTAFNPDGSVMAHGDNFIQRIGNKEYSTSAFVANADSFFQGSRNTFADWDFESHIIENHGTLLGVYFERVYYVAPSGAAEYPSQEQPSYTRKVVTYNG